MSNVTMASEGASAFSRGSWKCGNTVELTGTGLGCGPAASDWQSHRPEASSRSQWRAGNHRRSMRMARSEEHTSELQSPCNLVCRLLLEKKKKKRLSASITILTRRHDLVRS